MAPYAVDRIRSPKPHHSTGLIRGVSTFKVGDPVVFHDSLFSPLLHNNLKGQLRDVQLGEGIIEFTVE